MADAFDMNNFVPGFNLAKIVEHAQQTSVRSENLTNMLLDSRTPPDESLRSSLVVNHLEQQGASSLEEYKELPVVTRSPAQSRVRN